MTTGVVDLLDGPVHFAVVAEVMCRYHAVRWRFRIASRSVGAWRGLAAVPCATKSAWFRNDDDEAAAAEGYFVHVFVDRATQRPGTGA